LQFSYSFSRDLVNEAENRNQVELVWQELLGRPVQVRCALAGETSASGPAARSAPPTAATSGPTSGAAKGPGAPRGGVKPGLPEPAQREASASAAGGDDEVLLDDARRRGAIVKPLKSDKKRT
jgi:hypothetical protein